MPPLPIDLGSSSSPSSSPMEQQPAEPWNLLYEAADPVTLMRVINTIPVLSNPYSFHGHGGFVPQVRKPLPPPPSAATPTARVSTGGSCHPTPSSTPSMEGFGGLTEEEKLAAIKGRLDLLFTLMESMDTTQQQLKVRTEILAKEVEQRAINQKLLAKQLEATARAVALLTMGEGSGNQVSPSELAFPQPGNLFTESLEAKTAEELTEWRNALENAVVQATSVSNTVGQNPIVSTNITEPVKDISDVQLCVESSCQGNSVCSLVGHLNDLAVTKVYGNLNSIAEDNCSEGISVKGILEPSHLPLTTSKESPGKKELLNVLVMDVVKEFVGQFQYVDQIIIDEIMIASGFREQSSADNSKQQILKDPSENKEQSGQTNILANVCNLLGALMMGDSSVCLVLGKIPPWSRSAFSPGNSQITDSFGVLQEMPAWMCNGFSPGNEVTMT